MTDEAVNAEIIEVESFQPKSAVIVDLETKNKLKFITVKNCTSTADILQYFDSINNDSRTAEENEEPLLLKFQFYDNFLDLDSSDLLELLRKFGDKSTLMTLEAAVNTIFSIYWKSKENDEFLVLKPNLKLDLNDSKLLNQFVTDFLAESLQNNHLGEFV